MQDERENRLDELFTLARREIPDTGRLEEHFETRFMARLAERTAQTSPWQLLVWRMIPVFAAIAVIVLVCNFTMNPAGSGDPFAAITNGHEEQMTKNYLLGR
jgi:anti-sigma-K factor RskA